MSSSRRALVSGVLVVLGALSTLFVGVGPAQAVSRLNPGQTLSRGQFLTSGPYTLRLQTDGNLVLSEGSTVCWAAGSNTTDTRVFAIMQSDSNFVVYKYSHGPALWANGRFSDVANRWSLILGSDGYIHFGAGDGTITREGKLRNVHC